MALPKELPRNYDATKEFAPIPARETKNPAGHPRPRIGKTAKKHKGRARK